MQVANTPPELERDIFPCLYLTRLRLKYGNFAPVPVHQNGFARCLFQPGTVVAHLDIDPNVCRTLLGRNVLRINIGPLGFEERVKGQGGMHLRNDVKEHVAYDAAIQGIEARKEPAHRRAGLEFRVVAVDFDVQSVFPAEFDLRCDVKPERRYPVGAPSEQMPIQVKLSTLTDAFKLEQQAAALVIVGHGEVFAIRVRPEVLESALEALVAIPLVVGMRRRNPLPLAVIGSLERKAPFRQVPSRIEVEFQSSGSRRLKACRFSLTEGCGQAHHKKHAWEESDHHRRGLGGAAKA